VATAAAARGIACGVIELRLPDGHIAGAGDHQSEGV